MAAMVNALPAEPLGERERPQDSKERKRLLGYQDRRKGRALGSPKQHRHPAPTNDPSKARDLLAARPEGMRYSEIVRAIHRSRS